MAGRRVLSDHGFDRQVERLGGYEKLDSILYPVVDSLYANPFGAPVIDETEWMPLCRYICTKPQRGLPGFTVLFTIEDDDSVVLREIGRQKPTSAEQHKRFVETARELGCDEDEAAFEEKLRGIATVKPKPRTDKQKKGK